MIVAKLMDFIRALLMEPIVKNVDVNSSQLIDVHRQVWTRKPMIKEVFTEFYATLYGLDNQYLSGQGHRIEIGAGSSFFKQCYPDVMATDIKKSENLDKVMDAQHMDFQDRSVRSIYGIDCFHHFPDANLFFKELTRVLVPGGGCVLIEPYYGPLASFIFKYVLSTEGFDKSQKLWDYDPSQIGVMTGANQALSYIIFNRDLSEFRKKYPELNIIFRRPLNNYLRFFCSGSLNFRSLLPSWMSPLLKGVEFILSPLSKYLALHYVFVIKKNDHNIQN